MEAIRAIRNIRAEAEAAPSKKLRAVILASGTDRETLTAGKGYIMNLGNITQVTFAENKEDVPADSMSAVIAGAEIYIPLEDLVDFEAEYERLSKEKKRLEGEVKRVEGKLSNQGFVSKAPEKVVNEEREKMVKYKEMLEKVTARPGNGGCESRQIGDRAPPGRATPYTGGHRSMEDTGRWRTPDDVAFLKKNKKLYNISVKGEGLSATDVASRIISSPVIHL